MPKSDRYRGDDHDLMKIISDLRKRVSALERTPNIGRSSIDKSGTLRVRDENGIVRVEMGLLEDGSYGFAVKEDPAGAFQRVPFVYSDSIPTIELCNSTSFIDLETVGPKVTLTVGPSGRVVVIGACTGGGVSGLTGADGLFNVALSMAVWLSGANVYQPTGADELGTTQLTLHGDVNEASDDHGINGPLVVAAELDGLNPGVTTFTMKYKRTVAPTVSDGLFYNRTLTVITL